MKNESGFTFIEVIVSLVIFSVVTLVGLSFFGLEKQLETQSRYEMFALELAQNKMETEKLLTYPGIVSVGPVTVTHLGITFTTTITVTTIVAAGEIYKTIRVRIAWPGRTLDLYNIAQSAF